MYQEQLLKLQKKISQFELYLEEKDRTILEQENQLSELQDKLHEALKLEDSFKSQIKDRKLKVDELAREMKALKEQHEMQVSDFQQQLAAKDGSLQDAWQMASERELEISRYAA